ncbi:MAG: hypothetical protein QM635_02170 [Microbacteriaceae bacterium]
MRKFLFSTQILGAVLGGWSTVQTTRKGPRDWRLPLMWIAWGLNLAIAIGTVQKDAALLDDADGDLELDR